MRLAYPLLSHFRTVTRVTPMRAASAFSDSPSAIARTATSLPRPEYRTTAPPIGAAGPGQIARFAPPE